MICHKCGKENDLGIVNQAKRRFLCEKCVVEMLRPMGPEPDIVVVDTKEEYTDE